MKESNESEVNNWVKVFQFDLELLFLKLPCNEASESRPPMLMLDRLSIQSVDDSGRPLSILPSSSCLSRKKSRYQILLKLFPI